MSLTIDSSGRITATIDPDSDLDFELDLATWLADVGDTLASVTVTGTNCTVHDSGVVGTRVRAWVKEAKLGKPVFVTFRFTTSSTPPRIDDRTIHFTVVQK
jgi:hypothetical protein